MILAWRFATIRRCAAPKHQPQEAEMRLQDTIREVPDFPKKGILFYDITTLAKNPPAFHQAIDQLAEHYRDRPVDVVVSV